jgi:hypothetical protein
MLTYFEYIALVTLLGAIGYIFWDHYRKDQR